MTKGAIAFVLIVAAILSFFGFFIHTINVDEDRTMKRDQEWLIFSQRYHCKVVHESTFANPNVTWQCDGNFEVRR